MHESFGFKRQAFRYRFVAAEVEDMEDTTRCIICYEDDQGQIDLHQDSPDPPLSQHTCHRECISAWFKAHRIFQGRQASSNCPICFRAMSSDVLKMLSYGSEKHQAEVREALLEGARNGESSRKYESALQDIDVLCSDDISRIFFATVSERNLAMIKLFCVHLVFKNINVNASLQRLKLEVDLLIQNIRFDILDYIFELPLTQLMRPWDAYRFSADDVLYEDLNGARITPFTGSLNNFFYYRTMIEQLNSLCENGDSVRLQAFLQYFSSRGRPDVTLRSDVMENISRDSRLDILYMLEKYWGRPIICTAYQLDSMVKEAANCGTNETIMFWLERGAGKRSELVNLALKAACIGSDMDKVRTIMGQVMKGKFVLDFDLKPVIKQYDLAAVVSSHDGFEILCWLYEKKLIRRQRISASSLYEHAVSSTALNKGVLDTAVTLKILKFLHSKLKIPISGPKPMIQSATKGQKELVAFFMRMKAPGDQSALYWAAMSEQTEIVVYLLRKCVKLPDAVGLLRTLFTTLSQNGNRKLLTMLIRRASPKQKAVIRRMEEEINGNLHTRAKALIKLDKK